LALIYSNLAKYFNQKRVLVTGHTGFKGTWLCCALKALGANVCGLSLDPYSEGGRSFFLNSDFCGQSYYCDITAPESVKAVFQEFRPDIVFHLAAQPLVIKGLKEPRGTFDVNIGGSLNVLDQVRMADYPVDLCVVTSDKVYQNTDTQSFFSETSSLGGDDPYSASKACVEIISRSYSTSISLDGHEKRIVTARAGNVFGGGDWAIDRLIPDFFRSLLKKEAMKIRMPEATRPWQFVLDAVFGYLMLMHKVGGMSGSRAGNSWCGAWNFGPDADQIISVKSMVDLFNSEVSNTVDILVEPVGKGSEKRFLGVDSTKARELLGWKQVFDIQKSIKFSVQLYMADALAVSEIMRSQIGEFAQELDS